MAKRKPRATAAARAMSSESTARATFVSTEEATPPDSPYTQAASVLDDFFERERSSFSSGLVAAVDHYFSYGESGIAHSMIAEAAQKRAASGEGVNPRVTDAAAYVLNESD